MQLQREEKEGRNSSTSAIESAENKKGTLVEVKNIGVEYKLSEEKKLKVAENVSFDVPYGEFLVLMAPSGAGKSTLLRIIAGLEQPTEGEVRINGKKVNGPDDNVFMVFQNFALFPWKTVLENVELGLVSRKKLGKDEARSKALKAITKVGLKDFANSYPGELSGGMKQRVGLARAIALEPEIILLDEPFSSLDAVAERKLRQEIYSLVISDKSPIRLAIMVGHDVEEAVSLADRILVLSKRPMKIKKEIRIDLKRPRKVSSEKFHEYAEEIFELLG